jgi:hypothetical protein
MKVWLFHETLQPIRNMATCLAFFVQNSGYTSFIRRFPQFATGLSQVVETDSIAAALCQQLATGLLKTALLQLCHNSLRQAC